MAPVDGTAAVAGNAEAGVGPWLQPLGRRRFVVSAAARHRLAAVLDCLGLAPDRPYFVFGFTAQASAFVVGRRITLHRERYQSLTPGGQLGLIAHELVHVAQYAALGRAGVARFLRRYLPEYHLNPNNYRVPGALAGMPLREVRLLDPRYTLDQIAERFRHSVVERPDPPSLE